MSARRTDMQRALGLSLALAAFAAAGCDPGYGFRGRVREPGPCSEGADAPAPVAGATIELMCPDRTQPYLSAESAPDGAFAARRLGTLPAGCTLHVKKQGFAERTYAVADLCGVSIDAGEHCTSIAVDALLSAAAARGTDDAKGTPPP